MDLSTEDTQREGPWAPVFPSLDRPASWANLYWDAASPPPYESQAFSETSRSRMAHNVHQGSFLPTNAGTGLGGGDKALPRDSQPARVNCGLLSRVSFDVLHIIVGYVDSELDRSAIDLVCRDWLRHLGSHRRADLTVHDAKAPQLLRGCQAWSERIQERLRRTTTLRIRPRSTGKDLRICNAIFIFLGPCLPALRHLALESCLQRPTHLCFHKGLRLHCKGIRSLRISDLRGVTFAELRRILLACPKLDSLSLRGSRETGLGISLEEPLRSPSRHQSRGPDFQLRELEVCWLPRGLYEPLVHWLIAMDGGRSRLEYITHLTISDVCSTELFDLSTQLVEAIGPALQHLCIIRYHNELRACTHEGESGLLLTRNTSLRRLDIRIEPRGEAQDDPTNTKYNGDFPYMWETPGLTNMRHDSDPRDETETSVLTNMVYDGDSQDDKYPAFLRTWQHVLRTLPQTAWQSNDSFQLNVIAVSRNPSTGNSFQTVTRTLRPAELSNLMRGTFTCNHSDPLVFAGIDVVGSSQVCRFIVMDAADYWVHMKDHNYRSVRLTLPKISVRPFAWGVVQCRFDDEVLLATAPAVARHYWLRHPVFCPDHRETWHSSWYSSKQVEDDVAEAFSNDELFPWAPPPAPSPREFLRGIWGSKLREALARIYSKDWKDPGIGPHDWKDLRDEPPELSEFVAQLKKCSWRRKVEDGTNSAEIPPNDCKPENPCAASLEPSLMAFVKHFCAWHCYRNDSIAQKDDSLPDLRRLARRALEEQLHPWYSQHEQIAQLRASAALIDDEIEIMELSQDEADSHLELLSYHDAGIDLATFTCGQSGTPSDVHAQERLAEAVMRAQRIHAMPDIGWVPA